MCFIILGNSYVDGIKMIGPFTDETEADDYAYDKNIDDWCIVNPEKPDVDWLTKYRLFPGI